MDKRIAVTGEGPTDYGRSEYNKKTGEHIWKWGPVRNIMNHCLESYPCHDEIDFVPVQKEQLKSVKLLRSDKGVKGLSIPARKFVRYCRESNLEYGIYYADADKRETAGKTMREAKQHFHEVYSEVADGLEMGEKPAFIPMVPLKMIECWLLADEKAFQEDGKKSPSLPKYPELIWGDKHDPKSDYPKHLLYRVLLQCYIGDGQSYQEIYCQLAERIRIDILRKRCGISFGQFYQDFEKLLEA